MTLPTPTSPPVLLQLINDKKLLSERCEGVVGELKQVDQKYTKKIVQMQEQHEMVRSRPAALELDPFLAALHLTLLRNLLAVLLLFNCLFSSSSSSLSLFVCISNCFTGF